MGRQICEIKFDSGESSFHSGQFVSGKLVIPVEKLESIKGITLKLTGKAKTAWRAGRNSYYSASENYLNDELYFPSYNNKGQNSKNANFYLQEFIELPFSFKLPLNIPSTFKCDEGFIKYSLKAIVSSQSSVKFDKQIKQIINVLRILDLNTKPGAYAPYGAEIRLQKYICCLCCESGPILCIVKIPRIAYISGDRIQFRAELSNMSFSDVTEIVLSIVQRTTVFGDNNCAFWSNSSSKASELILIWTRGPILESGDTNIWSDSIQIPTLTPSLLEGCGIINLEYFLQIKLNTKVPGFFVVEKIPIIIGTIPLNSVIRNGEHHIPSVTDGLPALLSQYSDKSESTKYGVEINPAYSPRISTGQRQGQGQHLKSESQYFESIKYYSNGTPNSSTPMATFSIVHFPGSSQFPTTADYRCENVTDSKNGWRFDNKYTNITKVNSGLHGSVESLYENVTK